MLTLLILNHLSAPCTTFERNRYLIGHHYQMFVIVYVGFMHIVKR
jgi:hypothetical protein